MTTVRDEALLAFDRAQAAKPPNDGTPTEEEQAAEKQRAKLAAQTLKASPLQQWFPGHGWDVMDYSSLGSAAGFSDGTDIVVAPEDRSVYLLLTGEDNKVFAVTNRVDTETSYNYWSGPEVLGAADIGQYIASQEVKR